MSNPATIVSIESVAAACEAIEAAGGRVSVRSVMNHLGGGSPNAVTKYLREWREKKPLIEARKAIVIDPRIAELIAEQVSRAAGEASAEAIAKRDEVQADNDVLAAAGEALERERDQLQAQLAAAADRAQHDAGKIEQLEADLEKVRADAAAAIDAAKKEAAEAIALARAEAQAERAKSDELTHQKALLQGRVDSLKEKLADADKDLADVRAQYSKEHGLHVEAARKLSVAQSHIEDLQKRATECAEALKAANTRANQAERERSDAAAAAAGAKASAEAGAQLVTSLRERIKDLETALAKAGEKTGGQ